MQYLAVAIQDFTTDESLTFIHLLKEAGALPDWLETAVEAPDVQRLPDVAFADSHRRLMPIHNKSAAFLSAVSAVVYDYPSAGGWENRLKAACHSYGIVDLVKKAHDVLTPEEYHDKAANETTKIAHALELIVEPGQPVQQFYPINHRDEIESSALKLAADMHAQRLPGTWFAEAADRLMKAATAHGVGESQIPNSVRRLAADRLPSPEYLEEQVQRRVKQAGLPDEVAEVYRAAAQLALDKQADVLDAAHLWELADRKFGVQLSDTLASPVAAFRSGMDRRRFEKMAGEILTVAGVNLPFNQLQVLPDELAAAVLPTKIAAVVLQAKRLPDGIKAAGHLAALDEAEQLQVLELLTDNAGG